MGLKSYLYRILCWYFLPTKILDSLNRRKGYCKKCGKCCIMFGFKCIFLKDNRCRIYRFRPFFLCRLPPLSLTKEDIDRFKQIGCSYDLLDNKEKWRRLKYEDHN